MKKTIYTTLLLIVTMLTICHAQEHKFYIGAGDGQNVQTSTYRNYNYQTIDYTNPILNIGYCYVGKHKSGVDINLGLNSVFSMFDYLKINPCYVFQPCKYVSLNCGVAFMRRATQQTYVSNGVVQAVNDYAPYYAVNVSLPITIGRFIIKPEYIYPLSVATNTDYYSHFLENTKVQSINITINYLIIHYHNKT